VFFYIPHIMLRLFLILLLCALFAACSSDDSTVLKEWFDDQKIATSYGKLCEKIDVSFKEDLSGVGYDSSAYMVSSFAALGNVNNVEQILYFGFEIAGIIGIISPVWKLRTDSIFYTDINVPEDYKKNIDAKFYWLWEKGNETKHDTTWLKFQDPFEDSASISINWEPSETRDMFSISLPDAFIDDFSHRKASSGGILRLLVGIKALSNDNILRFAPPTMLDIPSILRVAQKTYIKECGNLCLYSGVRESLNVVFEISNKDTIKADKTVVFAQLILPKSSNNTVNELGYPLPVYVYDNGNLESYAVDTAFVKDYGHPNLVFWESDTLKLQVTKNLRNYVNTSKNATDLPDTFGFTLKLGTPMLNPTSLYFYNSSYSGTDKVFSDRPEYSSYNFSTVFKGTKLKLRLCYAETDIH